MRLWSLHPKYLDRAGLLACWRESLLAQAVIYGETHGYKNHPQVSRFDKQSICKYLWTIYFEAQEREFNFDSSKIKLDYTDNSKLPVTSAQLDYEWEHLQNKLRERSPNKYSDNLHRWAFDEFIRANECFFKTSGPIELWERIGGKHGNKD